MSYDDLYRGAAQDLLSANPGLTTERKRRLLTRLDEQLRETPEGQAALAPADPFAGAEATAEGTAAGVEPGFGQHLSETGGSLADRFQASGGAVMGLPNIFAMQEAEQEMRVGRAGGDIEMVIAAQDKMRELHKRGSSWGAVGDKLLGALDFLPVPIAGVPVPWFALSEAAGGAARVTQGTSKAGAAEGAGSAGKKREANASSALASAAPGVLATLGSPASNPMLKVLASLGALAATPEQIQAAAGEATKFAQSAYLLPDVELTEKEKKAKAAGALQVGGELLAGTGLVKGALKKGAGLVKGAASRSVAKEIIKKAKKPKVVEPVAEQVAKRPAGPKPKAEPPTTPWPPSAPEGAAERFAAGVRKPKPAEPFPPKVEGARERFQRTKGERLEASAERRKLRKEAEARGEAFPPAAPPETKPPAKPRVGEAPPEATKPAEPMPDWAEQHAQDMEDLLSEAFKESARSRGQSLQQKGANLQDIGDALLGLRKAEGVPREVVVAAGDKLTAIQFEKAPNDTRPLIEIWREAAGVKPKPAAPKPKAAPAAATSGETPTAPWPPAVAGKKPTPPTTPWPPKIEGAAERATKPTPKPATYPPPTSPRTAAKRLGIKVPEPTKPGEQLDHFGRRADSIIVEAEQAAKRAPRGERAAIVQRAEERIAAAAKDHPRPKATESEVNRRAAEVRKGLKASDPELVDYGYKPTNSDKQGALSKLAKETEGGIDPDTVTRELAPELWEKVEKSRQGTLHDAWQMKPGARKFVSDGAKGKGTTIDDIEVSLKRAGALDDQASLQDIMSTAEKADDGARVTLDDVAHKMAREQLDAEGVPGLLQAFEGERGVSGGGLEEMLNAAPFLKRKMDKLRKSAGKLKLEKAKPELEFPGHSAPKRRPASPDSDTPFFAPEPGTEGVKFSKAPKPAPKPKTAKDLLPQIGTEKPPRGQALPAKGPVHYDQVQAHMQQTWGTVIRGEPGKVGKAARGAAGLAKTKADVVRIKQGRLDAMAHEVAGHIAEAKSGNVQKFIKEHADELKALDYDAALVAEGKGRPDEGFAEFVNQWMTGSTDPATRAPTAAAAFEKLLKADKELGGKMLSSREAMRRLIEQGSWEAGRAHYASKWSDIPVRDHIKQAWLTLRRTMADEVAVVEEIEKHMRGIPRRKGLENALLEAKIPQEHSMTVVHRANAQSPKAVAQEFVLDGTYGLDPGVTTGESMAAALGPMVEDAKKVADLAVARSGLTKGGKGGWKKHFNDYVERWKTYAVARRSLELHGRGIEPGLSELHAETIVRDIEGQAFVDAIKARSRRVKPDMKVKDARASIEKKVKAESEVKLTREEWAAKRKDPEAFKPDPADVVEFKRAEAVKIDKEAAALEKKLTKEWDAYNEAGKTPVSTSKYNSFHESFERVKAWNDRVGDYLVESGAMSREAWDAMRAINNEFVSFQRDISGLVTHLGAGKKIGGTGKVIHKIAGSHRRIKDPLQSYVENTANMIEWGMKAQIGQAAKEMAKLEGAGMFIERIELADDAFSSAAEIAEGLKALGWASDQKTVSGVGQMLRNQALREVGRENVISFFEKGKPVAYSVHPELYTALMGQESGPGMRALINIFGPFARLKRLGATGLNAGFAIFTSPERDLIDTVTKDPKAAAYLPLAIVRSLIPKALWRDVNKYSDLYRRTGGFGSTLVGGDQQYIRLMSDQVLSQGGGSRGVAGAKQLFRHPMEIAREALSVFEQWPRKAAFEKAYKQALKVYGPKGGRSAALFAKRASAEITVDFGRAGSLGRQLNQIISFFNVSYQGPSRFIRFAKEHPARASVMIGALTAANVAEWWEIKDTLWFNMLRPSDIASRMFFRNTDAAGEPEKGAHGQAIPWQLSMPQEMGFVPGMAVVLLDHYYHKDPQGMIEKLDPILGKVLGQPDFVRLPKPGIKKGEGADRTVVEWLAPDTMTGERIQSIVQKAAPMIPGISSPVEDIMGPYATVSELLDNIDRYRQRAVVAPHLLKLEARDQYSARTTETAKALGNMMGYGDGVSPTKIEHFLRGLTAGLGPGALRFVDKAYFWMAGTGKLPTTDAGWETYQEELAADLGGQGRSGKSAHFMAKRKVKMLKKGKAGGLESWPVLQRMWAYTRPPNEILDNLFWHQKDLVAELNALNPMKGKAEGRSEDLAGKDKAKSKAFSDRAKRRADDIAAVQMQQSIIEDLIALVYAGNPELADDEPATKKLEKAAP